MQFSIATVVALASVVLAVPSNIMERGNSICPEGTTNNNAVCCDTSVAGAANLNCDNKGIIPTNGVTFKKSCVAQGKQPYCCTLVVAGQGVLCVEPVGTEG